MATSTIEKHSHTLAAPGATIVYDVRRNDGGDRPTLMMIGSPMAAAGFASLAGNFDDRTVVTYDPRGSERSVRDDPTSPVDPDTHADDVSRVIEAVGSTPVDLFASSGGAVNALALLVRHPGQVRRLVAHEPPLVSLLPDHEAARAATRAVGDTYRQRGWGAAMAHFIAVSGHEGPFAPDFADRPGPDPSSYGLPVEDDGSRDDPLLGQNIITCTHYEPDLESLRASSTEIFVAAGRESGEQLASRSARALATRLDVEPIMFPSDHGGFLGGEYGQTGDPGAFAKKLREILDG
ncbi:MAG: alpha/beta hydrolase [Acidimicrobiia bacterium]